MPLPDEGGRAEILGVHLRGVTLAEPDADRVCEQLARVTGGGWWEGSWRGVGSG